MNLLEHVVIAINGPPTKAHGKWWVNVTYDCYGSAGTTDIMFNSEEDANDLAEGFVFLA